MNYYPIDILSCQYNYPTDILSHQLYCPINLPMYYYLTGIIIILPI